MLNFIHTLRLIDWSRYSSMVVLTLIFIAIASEWLWCSQYQRTDNLPDLSLPAHNPLILSPFLCLLFPPVLRDLAAHIDSPSGPHPRVRLPIFFNLGCPSINSWPSSTLIRPSLSSPPTDGSDSSLTFLEVFKFLHTLCLIIHKFWLWRGFHFWMCAEV